MSGISVSIEPAGLLAAVEHVADEIVMLDIGRSVRDLNRLFSAMIDRAFYLHASERMATGASLTKS